MYCTYYTINQISVVKIKISDEINGIKTRLTYDLLIV